MDSSSSSSPSKMMALTLLPHSSTCLPFLTAFKDGLLLDSFCLDARDCFLLGRHTNCDILLAHPSISRLHLQIQLLHPTRQLLLTDLDSVHGTWINGEKAPALAPIIAKEGDTIKLGASSRTYKVQWLPRPQTNCSSGEQSDMDSLLQSADSSENSTNPGALQPVSCPSEPRDLSCVEIHPTEEEFPRIRQEIRIATGSVNGIDTFNANISLQILHHKGGGPPLPPRAPPARRVPFAPLQITNSPSPKLQKRKGTEKKSNGHSRAIEATTEGDGIDSGKHEKGIANGISPKLWLRRCTSAPPPRLLTSIPSAPALPLQGMSRFNNNNRTVPSAPPLPPGGINEIIFSTDEPLSIKTPTNVVEERRKRIDGTSENAEVDRDGIGNENATETQSVEEWQAPSLDEGMEDEGYASDKENQGPAFHPTKMSKVATKIQADGCATEVPNLDHIRRKLHGMVSSEAHREWHIIADITSLLDADSLKSLKLLEGIKEVRLIIPKVVIRELDCLKRRERSSSGAASKALKWIESCMVTIPSWIHVQSSSESLPITATPPASPHYGPAVSPTFGANLGDLMSPTNGDHVLDCALVFRASIADGQVAVLTNDTALKIKAMAEGLLCESAATFSESLLSPYSERFLWTGSTACGPNWTEKACHTNNCLTVPNATFAELNKNKTLMSAARAMASKKHHVVEGLRNHCKQAQGLKSVLT